MAFPPRTRRRVAVTHRNGQNGVCDCRPWGLLDRVQRDYILAEIMKWAWLYYKVRLHEDMIRYPVQGRGHGKNA